MAGLVRRLVRRTGGKSVALVDDLFDEQQGRPIFRPRKRRKPEAKVQKAIASWLLSRGVVLAITDAGILNKMGLGMSCGVPEGWPDITGCLPDGRFIGVECKAPKGKQSQAQIEMQAKIEGNGGLYLVAHSVGELVTILRTEKLSGTKFGIPIDGLTI
jgi:hypothetical protein